MTRKKAISLGRALISNHQWIILKSKSRCIPQSHVCALCGQNGLFFVIFCSKSAKKEMSGCYIIINLNLIKERSSCSEVFHKKGILRNFAKFLTTSFFKEYLIIVIIIIIIIIIIVIIIVIIIIIIILLFIQKEVLQIHM